MRYFADELADLVACGRDALCMAVVAGQILGRIVGQIVLVLVSACGISHHRDVRRGDADATLHVLHGDARSGCGRNLALGLEEENGILQVEYHFVVVQEVGQVIQHDGVDIADLVAQFARERIHLDVAVEAGTAVERDVLGHHLVQRLGGLNLGDVLSWECIDGCCDPICIELGCLEAKRTGDGETALDGGRVGILVEDEILAFGDSGEGDGQLQLLGDGHSCLADGQLNLIVRNTAWSDFIATEDHLAYLQALWIFQRKIVQIDVGYKVGQTHDLHLQRCGVLLDSDALDANHVAVDVPCLGILLNVVDGRASLDDIEVLLVRDIHIHCASSAGNGDGHVNLPSVDLVEEVQGNRGIDVFNLRFADADVFDIHRLNVCLATLFDAEDGVLQFIAPYVLHHAVFLQVHDVTQKDAVCAAIGQFQVYVAAYRPVDVFQVVAVVHACSKQHAARDYAQGKVMFGIGFHKLPVFDSG